MSSYLIAIDQGTTGTTSVLVDANDFTFIDKISVEFRQIYPQTSFVEHDLSDIWNTIEHTVSKLIKKNNISDGEIVAIGITNQRETVCSFNSDGTPLANAIVWQDRRSFDTCEKIKKSSDHNYITSKTGLPIDPYFSATKIKWLLDNNENIKNAQIENNLFFGTIDTFLLYKLTAGESYYTEASNASRTLLMDLKTCNWDRKLLDIFKIDKKNLPEIKESFSNFGVTKNLSFLPDGIPITGILGDQQSALFGQAGFKKGSMKCTYGTGAFLLLNTGSTIKKSKFGLLSTVAYKYKGKVNYALEGSSYIAGAAVQWMRDNLSLIDTSAEIENLAKSVSNLHELDHLVFLPFFTGIGSPYWNSTAKGAILGITRDIEAKHLAMSCLNGIALSVNDLVESMRNDVDFKIDNLNVDGGACSNNLLMEIQATISNLNIIRPKTIETTAYGAALAAAVGHNILDIDNIKNLWHRDRSFGSSLKNVNFYNMKKKQWKTIIESGIL